MVKVLLIVEIVARVHNSTNTNMNSIVAAPVSVSLGMTVAFQISPICKLL